MKKKHHHNHKFKPLQQLYTLPPSLIHPKVDSESEIKLKRDFYIKDLAGTCWTSNTCAGPYPSYEHIYNTVAEMENSPVSLSELSLEETSIGQASVDEVILNTRGDYQEDPTHNKTSGLACSGSCQSSYAKDGPSSDCLKASDVIEEQKLLQNVHTLQAIVKQQNQDNFACQGDDRSCISKDTDVAMTSTDHNVGADSQNVTSSATSVSSACPEVVEISVNGQPTMTRSVDQLSNEEGENCSFEVHKCSPEAVLTATDSSDRSDPSATSLSSDKRNGINPAKGVLLECSKEQVDSFRARIMDFHVPLCSVSENSHESLKPENQIVDGNLSARTPLNGPDENELLRTTPSTSALEPPLQSPNKSQSDNSDELVDVNVCDICGDIGREALLVVCSKCNEGAEHIYCMRIKMEEVPIGDWTCEECMTAQDSKGQCHVSVRRLDKCSNPPSLEESRQFQSGISSDIQQVGEVRTKLLNKASHLSDKKPGPCTETRLAPEQIVPVKSTQSLKLPGCKSKAQLTRTSSMKDFDKTKNAASPLSGYGDRGAKRASEQTSDHRLPKPEKRFCEGTLQGRKSDDISVSRMKAQQLRKVIFQRSSSVKRSADSELEKHHAEKRLCKSMSFSGVSSGLPNVSNAHSSYGLKVRGQKYGNGRDLTESPFMYENKIKQSSLSFVGSGSRKEQSSLDTKAIRVSGASKVNPSGFLAPEGRKCSIKSGKSIENKLSHCRKSYAIKSPVKTVESHPNKKSIQPCVETELDTTSRNNDSHFVVSGKARPPKLLPVKAKTMLVPAVGLPPAESAVPAAESIWKGAFKLENNGKLPNSCSGVQAHLATCASSKVHELASKLRPKLLLKEVARLKSWPIQFKRNYPSEKDIALYFFAENHQSYSKSYKILVEAMVIHDLALEADFDGVQLLVFPSSLLPVTSQRWNSLLFLWGVYRVSKVDDRCLHLPSLDIENLNHYPVTDGSESKCVSPLEAGSSFACHSSHNSIDGVAINPVVLQTSALTNSQERSYGHGVYSLKCSDPQEENDFQTDTIGATNDSIKGETSSSKVSDIDCMQRGTEFDDQDVKCISKAEIFPSAKSNGENMVFFATNSRQSGFYSDGSDKSSSFLLVCDSIFPRLDVANRRSFSIDSGPSGSSDGHTKSDEVQAENSENPDSFSNLNLDLCLGSSSGPETQVDLDLVLGFPSQYQPNFRTMDWDGDGKLSLGLSLGMCDSFS